MLRYRVVAMRCLDIRHPVIHRHVPSVVTRPGRSGYEGNWTAAEVSDAIAQGDSFYTLSESTGKVAEIETYTCPICGQCWIRTDDQAVADNQLEALPHANGHARSGVDLTREVVGGDTQAAGTRLETLSA